MSDKLFSFSTEWIVSMDDDLIVINKPSGLLTIPDGYDQDLPCLSRSLEKEFSKIWVVHRLDKETSGLVLFARNSQCHKQLNAQFLQRSVKKLYTAIICGHPKWQYFDIRLPLQIDGDRKHRTVVNTAYGRPARTEENVIRRLEEEVTWVEVFPYTGYTHQIRTHLAALNSPILNDFLYSKSSSATTPNVIRISRIALHASRISFIHPANHLPIEYTAPFPSDFQKLIGNSDSTIGSIW